jgi:hypothetical protein
MVQMLRDFEINVSFLFWALFVVEIVFFVTFAWFTIVFFFHLKLMRREYVIKEKFNIIIQFSYINKFAYLESLAKNNSQLLPLITNIKSNKNFFDAQLEKLRKKIIVLTEINSKYKYKLGRQFSNEIEVDLIKCEVMMKRLKDISSSATEYSKNVADLIIEYRTLSNQIINFYEINLSLRYTDEIFKNLHKAIEQTMSEASKFIIKINNDELMTLLTQLNKHVMNFYQTTLNLYIYDHILFYLTSLQTSVTLSFKTNSRSLSSTDQVNIERMLATAANNLQLISRALKQININEAKNNAIIALKNLSNARVTIEVGEKSRILIQKDMHFLNGQVLILSKQIKDISTAFNNIKKYFDQTDPHIISKISRLVADMNTIVVSYQSLQLEYKDIDSIQSKGFLEKIYAICNNIINWHANLNELIDDIKDKYKTSIKINNELADLKLTLVQTLFIKQPTTENEKNTEVINTLIKHVSALQEMLVKNYFANYALVNNEITKIKDQMQLVFQKSTFDQTLKLYAQRLIFFLNKYRNEHEEIDKIITTAEKAYQQNKYQVSIDVLVDALTKIKESAKMHHISIN